MKLIFLKGGVSPIHEIWYNDAEFLFKNLARASKVLGLKIEEPEWVEMGNGSTVKEWTDLADDYFGSNKSDYDFAVFLLGRDASKYTKLNSYFYFI